MGRMMTKEEIRPVMLAWLDDQTVQCRNCNETEWMDCHKTICAFDPTLEWRIKPGNKFRPWKLEEVPVGTTIRSKNTQDRTVISGVSHAFIYIWGNEAKNAQDIFDLWLTLDGKPCGVEQ